MWYKIIFFGLPFLLIFITFVLIEFSEQRIFDKYTVRERLDFIMFALGSGVAAGLLFYLISTILFSLITPYHYTEATSGVLYVMEQKTYRKENKFLYYIETVNGEIIIPTHYSAVDVGKKVEVLVQEQWVIDEKMNIRIEAKASEVN